MEKLLSKTSSLLLIGVLVSILGMILLPLSPSFLDFFLASNLTGALLLLLTSFYISDTLKIASFPTILLVSTLFRLALEIAASRLILTTGEGGEVIQTFGEFAVGGSLVVGIIIFLMVTFVQFVVIAKGSERVAEVAARFNLDALPGRQMSIDADLRAGVITGGEARAAREKLRYESRLFGAMDGAMKFVKGDALAGIFITFINLFGGIVMGVLLRHLPLSEALQTYSLLTIGSGLVSQIPSLLISLAAGVLLTRIVREDSSSHLGHEITTQIFRQPRALGVASLLVGTIGFVPGFPTSLFLGMALLLGALSVGLASLQKRVAEETKRREFVESYEIAGSSTPFTLELSPPLHSLLSQAPEWRGFLDKLLPQTIRLLSNDVGINLPLPRITTNPSLPENFFRTRIQDIVFSEGKVIGKKELLLHVARTLREAAPRFLTIQEVKNRLRRLEAVTPDLVNEVIPRLIQIQKLTEVLQRLAREGIVIKDLQRILHELALLNPEGKDPLALSELLRSSLRDQITQHFTGQTGILSAFLLDSEIEEMVEDEIRRQGEESYLVMPPDQMGKLLRIISEVVPTATGKIRGPILTRPEVRRFVRKIVETKYPSLPVLSFNELEPHVVIRPLGKITLRETEMSLAMVGT